MDLEAQINELEEMVSQARRVPLSSSILVSEKGIFDLIDQLRANLPEELKQARWIIKERSEMLDEARREADKILAEARIKADEMIAETEVVRSAKKESAEILEEARSNARKIRLEAEDYADEKLANMEATLHRMVSTIRKGREKLQGKVEKVQDVEMIEEDASDETQF
jgi:cell division septum initiation protein DivIVA